MKFASRNDPWAFGFVPKGYSEQIYIHPYSVKLISPIEDHHGQSRIYGTNGLTWTTEQELFALVMRLAEARKLYERSIRRHVCKELSDRLSEPEP